MSTTSLKPLDVPLGADFTLSIANKGGENVARAWPKRVHRKSVGGWSVGVICQVINSGVHWLVRIRYDDEREDEQCIARCRVLNGRRPF